MIGLLRHAVHFDCYVWVVTDPRTAVGVDPLAKVPDLRRLPQVIARKYRTDVNHWMRLTGPAALGPDAPRSELWRDEQRAAGVVDVASMVFRDRFGVWGFLDLWSDASIDEATLSLLREIAEPVTAALRRGVGEQLRRLPEPFSLEPATGQAATPAAGPTGRPAPAPTPDSSSDAGGSGGPAVVLLDASLAVQGMTEAARSILGRLLPRQDGGPAVPAAAFNVAAQLLATEAGLATESGLELAEPVGRVHLGDGHWVTLRASRVEPGTTIAVSIEPLTAGDRFDLCVRAFGLTPRERTVATEVARGSSTTTIAASLSISANTVQDHLKAIFAKVGVHSRRDLAPILVGVES